MRTSRQRFALASALVTLVVLSLGACGGDDDDGSGSTSPSGTEVSAHGDIDPCELVTADEAEEVLGEPVTDGEHGSTAPYESCTYNVESVAVKFVLVQVRTGISLDDFRSSIEDAAEFLDENPETVDGVGDAAYVLAGLLYSHDGDVEVVMSVVLGVGEQDEDAVLESEKELAITALERAQ
jgi:hypothetical protein